MEKEYRHSLSFKVITLLCLAIGIGGTFTVNGAFGIALKLISIICFGWLALFLLRLRIIVNDNFLVKDAGKLMKRTESDWDQITRISQLPSAFLNNYKIQCADKPSIMIPDTMDNYKDLLREIVERSPNAIVDDSIRDFLRHK